MKVTFLFQDLEGPGPVWRNGFWPILSVFNQYTDVQFVTIRRESWASRSWIGLGKGIVARAQRTTLKRTRLDSKKSTVRLRFGIALNQWMVDAISAVDHDLAYHTHSVLYVSENVEPYPTHLRTWRVHDLILCFCPELASIIEERTGVRTLYWPPHSDVLGLHSLRRARPIDLLVMGRTDTDFLFHLQDLMLDDRLPLTVLDYVTRPNEDRTRSAEKEFRLLCDMHSRARAVTCFEPSGLERYKGRSPLLGRWVYAWMSGTSVFGTAPLNPISQLEMDWPGAMFQLPSRQEDAVDLIRATLTDKPLMDAQSHRNVAEAMRRHDTRHRIVGLLRALGLEPSSKLVEDAERCIDLAERIEKGAQ